MLWAHLLLPLLGSAAKPKIVLVLTDDQDLLFDSMRAMPFTTSFLGQGGVSFSNFFAHTPVCCPSRGELLSGRYLHNTSVSFPHKSFSFKSFSNFLGRFKISLQISFPDSIHWDNGHKRPQTATSPTAARQGSGGMSTPGLTPPAA